MTTVPEYFGSLVFDTRVMKARLSADVYRSLKQTIQKGAKLDPSVANAVLDCPVLHGRGDGVGHGRVQLCALLDGLLQRAVYIRG